MVTRAETHANGDDDDIDVTIDVDDDSNNHNGIDIGDANQHTERKNSIIVDQVDIIPTVHRHLSYDKQGICYDMIYEYA